MKFKFNWKTIVGAIFVLSGLSNFKEGIGFVIYSIVVGGALILWGMQEKDKPKKKINDSFPANVPERESAEESVGKKKEAEEEARVQAEREAAEEAARKEKEAEEETRVQADLEAERNAYEEALQKRKNAYGALMDSTHSADIVISDTRADLLDTGCLANISNTNITKRTDWNKLGNFVVIDTETTGLRATCGVLEIAAVRFRDWAPVEKFHSLCSVDKPIPEDATKINHITDEMVAGKPHFRQLTASLLDFIGADALVGHNIGFDLKFIVRNGADVTSTKRKYYDTLEIAQRILKKYEDVDNYKLPTLCRYYGIHMPDAHRADCDAITTGLLFKHLAHERIEGMPSIPDIEITE